jgi:hypothetical protein
MKPIIVIFYFDLAGGTGTLSITLGKNLVNKGYKVIQICQEINDPNNQRILNDLGVETILLKKSELCSMLDNKYGAQQSYRFITYTFGDYLFVEKLRKKIIIENNVYYVAHVFGLMRGRDKEEGFKKKLIKSLYLTIIKSMIKRNRLMFMEELAIGKVEEYFDIEFDKSGLFRKFAYEVKPFNFEDISSKLNFDSFNLLTISRADFPFKGYMLGLIKEFVKIYNVYEEVTLTIITFGKDIKVLYDLVESLPAKIRERISIVDQVPYDELIKYFNKTHLYIGMSTTILDAVNHGVPSLTVGLYTYECNVAFFHESTGTICDKKTEKTFLEYVIKVIQMNSKEYKNLVELEHDKLVKSYDVDSVTEYILRDHFNYKSLDILSNAITFILEWTKGIGIY